MFLSLRVVSSRASVMCELECVRWKVAGVRYGLTQSFPDKCVRPTRVGASASRARAGGSAVLLGNVAQNQPAHQPRGDYRSRKWPMGGSRWLRALVLRMQPASPVVSQHVLRK